MPLSFTRQDGSQENCSRKTEILFYFYYKNKYGFILTPPIILELLLLLVIFIFTTIYKQHAECMSLLYVMITK